MSVVAHFFMSVGGSKIHERLAHFFIDIYRWWLVCRLKSLSQIYVISSCRHLLIPESLDRGFRPQNYVEEYSLSQHFPHQ